MFGGANQTEPTRFGYLQADYFGAKKSAIFQFCLDRDDQLSMVDRPAEIRIDVTPRGNRRTFSGSRPLADQSIPVWQIELSDWPADGKPEVTASWKMIRTDSDGLISLGTLLKDPQSPVLRDWPEKSLTVSAERQSGKVLIQLKLMRPPANKTYRKSESNWDSNHKLNRNSCRHSFNGRSKYYEAGQQITYEFDVDNNFDEEQARVSLTSRSSLVNGATTLESPLLINKWDREQ